MLVHKIKKRAANTQICGDCFDDMSLNSQQLVNVTQITTGLYNFEQSKEYDITDIITIDCSQPLKNYQLQTQEIRIYNKFKSSFVFNNDNNEVNLTTKCKEKQKVLKKRIKRNVFDFTSAQQQPEHSRIQQILSVQQALSLSTNLKYFVNSHLPRDTVIGAKILKKKNTLSTQYKMTLKSDLCVLMVAETKIAGLGLNCHISLEDKKYIGKVRYNSNSKIYKIYNEGENPKNSYNVSKWRQTVCELNVEEQSLSIPNLYNHKPYPDNLFRIEESVQLKDLEKKFKNCVTYCKINRSECVYTVIDNQNVILNTKKKQDGYEVEGFHPFTPLQMFGIAIIADNAYF